MTNKRIHLKAAICAAVLFVGALQAQPQVGNFGIVGLGDSIGQGVQSGDASWRTQPHSYLKLIAFRLGVPFRLPLIRSNPLGLVGGTLGRSRIHPNLRAANLAVSGADVARLLRRQADGVTDSETDLVLMPNLGSQIEVAESYQAGLLICWIGNNDVLAAITAFDQLDGSQMTPVADFQADFTEIAARLAALGQPLVLANIPDIDKTSFLLNRDDLIGLLGSDFGLPAGHLTSLVEGIFLKLGLDSGENLNDPGFVLDPAEQALIQQRVDDFNQIIADAAALHGVPVVDINGLFDEAVANPPVIQGVTLNIRYLGGLTSLDGLHPSNIGHALIANKFIQTMNEAWAANFPLIPQAWLDSILANDPFVDKDGDGTVTGRPLASLLETLGPLLGVSGDPDDNNAAVTAPSALTGEEFLSALPSQARSDGVRLSRAEAQEIIKQAFGLDRFRPRRR